MLNIYKIIKNTKVEGPDTRFCIWVQGCKKHCKGCFAKETWEFNIGKNYTVEELFQLISAEKNIQGVTFLGGEPFEQALELSKLAKRIKEELGLSIVCFTGYKYEELIEQNKTNHTSLLKYVDLLIDGGFEEENFDLSRAWVGSKNQRYIFLSDTYSEKDIEKYTNKIETRIFPDGKIEVNGMGDFNAINQHFHLQLGKNVVRY